MDGIKSIETSGLPGTFKLGLHEKVAGSCMLPQQCDPVWKRDFGAPCNQFNIHPLAIIAYRLEGREGLEPIPAGRRAITALTHGDQKFCCGQKHSVLCILWS